ncbi:phage antirepressor KilAC domain-containing protein [Paenibacillus lautus]|uniref:phage antirepressor KilAC domain-containing protein n=1 Tax=Paenibacillus lautus TaxID=1401 RepID=UPI003D2B10C3
MANTFSADVISVMGVRGYIDENGTANLNLEDVARGFGFTRTAASGNKVVRWDRVRDYLSELGVPTSGHEGKDSLPEYIKENIFYRFGMIAKNSTAMNFQARVADEILPTIRKTGGYVANDDLFINTYLPHADPQIKHMFRATLQTVRDQNNKIAVMQPKADYFDAIVDRNLLTNFRRTAQELHVYEGKFIEWLLDEGYLYRNSKKELMAYARYIPELFDNKDWVGANKAGVQTLITPKGKETFRLLIPEEIKKKVRKST